MRERSSEEEDEKEETVLREKEEEDVIVDIWVKGGWSFSLEESCPKEDERNASSFERRKLIILEVKDLYEYAEENEENDEEKSKVPWVEHKFAIGDATHPEGLEEALLKMRVNDIAEVKIFASSEYQLCDALLPETQTITFTALFVVKVVEVTDDSVTDDKFAMSHRERLEYGEKMLERGRMLYQTKRYRRAKLMWDKGWMSFRWENCKANSIKTEKRKTKSLKSRIRFITISRCYIWRWQL